MDNLTAFGRNQQPETTVLCPQIDKLMAVGNTLALARAYVALGLSLIPVKSDGTKSPAEQGWREYTSRQPSDAELFAWFDVEGRYGIGFPGGPASLNLCVLDFEKWQAFTEWYGMLTDADRCHLTRSPVVRTPSGGAHVYLRLAGSVRGARYARDTMGKCLIETRGEGHQVVAPGSPVSCHRTGIPYRLIRPGWLDGAPFEPIPLDVFQTLTFYAAELNRYRKPAAREIIGDRPTGQTQDRPGDHFNVRVSWSDILKPHGWRVYRSTGATTYWCRPGKSPAGISASTGFCRGFCGSDLLYVFSTSAPPFESETSYSRFAAYALLNHHGDFANATRALSRAGYGRPLCTRKVLR